MPATTIASSGAPPRSDLRMDAFGSWVMLAAISARSASRSALRERRGGALARRRSSRCSSVARASPASSKVFAWLRPISPVSTSTWITCCSGFGAASARRLPTTRITSADSRYRGTLGAARLDELHLPLALHRVGRHLEVDGARPPSPELLDRLVGGARDVGDLEDAPPPLRDRRDRVELIVDLVEHADVLPELGLGDLAREHQHRRGGGVGRAEAGGRVEESGPRHDEGGAKGRAGSGIPVGHVARGRLVTRDDEADARLVPERGHHAVELDAGQAEHHTHAFPVKLLHERLAAGHACHLTAPPRLRPIR